MNGNHLNQNQAISIFDPDTLYNAKKKAGKKDQGCRVTYDGCFAHVLCYQYPTLAQVCNMCGYSDSFYTVTIPGPVAFGVNVYR